MKQAATGPANSGTTLLKLVERASWNRIGTTSILAAFLGLSAAAGWAEGAPEPKKPDAANLAEPRVVELRGKVVCLPEAMHELYGTDLPTGHAHVYGFETEDGSFYTLLRTKYSEPLFADERVRKQELLLKGRIFPKTHLFEVQRTRSVRQGKVYDVFYYCPICHIETISPGPCECCQGPVELTERPIKPLSR